MAIDVTRRARGFQPRLPALRLFDPGPGVAQGYGSVEDEVVGGRIVVQAVVTLALELEPGAGHRPGHTWLDPTGSNLQRVRVQVREVGLTLLDVVRIGLDEQWLV